MGAERHNISNRGRRVAATREMGRMFARVVCVDRRAAEQLDSFTADELRELADAMDRADAAADELAAE